MKKGNLLHSFKYAFSGLFYVIKTERNFKIHLLCGTLAFISSLFVKMSSCEYAILCLTIGMVLMAELFNTAIENTVDLVCGKKFDFLAKLAKDISAAAVLVLALFSVAIEYFIVIRKLI